MSNKKRNIYEDLYMVDELWEKRDEKKDENTKKLEKKQKIAQKKTEDDDLKSAAFRPPVQQKKKNQRPIRGQKRVNNCEPKKTAQVEPVNTSSETSNDPQPTVKQPIPESKITDSVEVVKEPVPTIEPKLPSKPSKPKKEMPPPKGDEEFSVRSSLYNQLVDQLKALTAQVAKQYHQIEEQREEIENYKAMISILQSENAMLRKKINN